MLCFLYVLCCVFFLTSTYLTFKCVDLNRKYLTLRDINDQNVCDWYDLNYKYRQDTEDTQEVMIQDNRGYKEFHETTN